MAEQKSLKMKRKELLKEYGMTFVCISFTIFIIEMIVLVTLISWMGWSAQDMASALGLDIEIPETSGTWVMAYMITRALKIPQLILTGALTPPTAKALRKWRAQRVQESNSAGHDLDSIPVSEKGAEATD